MTQYCKALMHYAKKYSGKGNFPWSFYRRLKFPQLRTWRAGLLETTPKKHCPWIPLEWTISRSPHYPDGSQTSEIWSFGPQLPIEKGSSRLLNCTPARDLKLKLTTEVPPQKQKISWTVLPRWRTKIFISNINSLSLLFAICFFSLIMPGRWHYN